MSKEPDTKGTMKGQSKETPIVKSIQRIVRYAEPRAVSKGQGYRARYQTVPGSLAFMNVGVHTDDTNKALVVGLFAIQTEIWSLGAECHPKEEFKPEYKRQEPTQSISQSQKKKKN